MLTDELPVLIDIRRKKIVYCVKEQWNKNSINLQGKDFSIGVSNLINLSGILYSRSLESSNISFWIISTGKQCVIGLRPLDVGNTITMVSIPHRMPAQKIKMQRITRILIRTVILPAIVLHLMAVHQFPWQRRKTSKGSFINNVKPKGGEGGRVGSPKKWWMVT